MDVFEQVRRENIDRYKVEQIGWGHQGSVYKISVNGQTAVVKDISNKSLPYRLLFGRWVISRECKVYERLKGLPGVPKIFHKVDRDGFIFEYVDGAPLSSFAKDAPIPTVFFDALAGLVEAIHNRGVVHSDLKHKKNILVSSDYQPYLVDFGASWIAGPRWNFIKSWLYDQFYQVDLTAVSKIRKRFISGNPGPQDLRNLARRNFMEKCSTLYQWVYRFFSKKHAWKRRSRT
jgi:serine/threonine protein kinase